MEKETKAKKIVNTISKKQKTTIRVIRKCNSRGEIDIDLYPEFVPNEPDASYSISLIKFAAINNISNVNESNNKFVYKTSNDANATKKTVTLPTGFYDIEQYNKEVKRQVKEQSDEADNIDISINNATGIVCIKLQNGYSVSFNEPNTFRDSLGFDAEEITGNKIHEGKRICNLLPTQSIFIHCSVVTGNKLIKNKQCENSDIIFDFAFNYKYGSPMTFMLDPKLTESEVDLSCGRIRTITMRFTDDNDNPVVFGTDPVSITLRIRQD